MKTVWIVQWVEDVDSLIVLKMKVFRKRKAAESFKDSLDPRFRVTYTSWPVHH